MAGLRCTATHLLADGTGAEHGEAALHEEDHGPGEQKVEYIEPGRHLADGRVGVIERRADRGGRIIGRCLAVGILVEFAHGEFFA